VKFFGEIPQAARLLVAIGVCLAAAAPARALAGAGDNFWPVFTSRAADAFGRPDTFTAAAPFFERKSPPDRSQRILSLRPLFTEFDDAARDEQDTHWLYPLFTQRQSPHRSAWNVLSFARGSHYTDTGTHYLEIWPFYIARDTGRPEDSYRAVFPFYGTLKHRLWRDRIDFLAFPFYVRTQLGDETRRHFPYPFLQYRSGPHSSGFGVWPLFGAFARENDYRHSWILWPLHYDLDDDLDKAVPRNRFGLLPFYASETAEGLRSRTFVWPFFGYTTHSAPRPDYHEVRYFWPFIVQGRGDERYRNRLLPLFSHERMPGYEKSWVLWPLFRTEQWQPSASTPARERSTILYFLFDSDTQTAPGLHANKTLLWPLFGMWDNGEGQRQFQLFDPLSIFFKSNRAVRENWTPLFALYRYDARAGSSRHSLLWNLLVLEREAGGGRAFQLGPLFEYAREGGSEGAGEWQILKGLIGARRGPDGTGGLRLLWMDL